MAIGYLLSAREVYQRAVEDSAATIQDTISNRVAVEDEVELARLAPALAPVERGLNRTVE